MLGVKTIGNATLIAFDGEPVLATDPWIGDEDDAYFGSWTLSHEIPVREKEEIQRARYVWFLHGHPDHQNPHSVQRFRGHRILLPDHVGGRIRSDLEREGFDVSVLPDRKWVELSPRIRVFCIPDFIQDAALLVEINDSLFLNLNDSSVRGYAGLVRRMAKRYPRSYVMRLSGSGDADMINLFDKEGNRIPFRGNPTPGGKQLSDLARMWGTNHAIPFSSFHRYQRADSV